MNWSAGESADRCPCISGSEMYEDMKIMKSDRGICMKTQPVGHDLLLVNPVIKLQVSARAGLRCSLGFEIVGSV